MELAVWKIDLLNAIDRVIGAVDKRAHMPMLSHVLIQVSRAGVIKLAATDLQIYARTECPASVEVEGAIVAPAEKLRAAVDKCGAQICIALDDSLKLNLDSEGCHYDLACLDAEDFPAFFGDDAQHMVSLVHGVLPAIVRSLRHAVCVDDARPNICGIHLQASETRITAAATDGHRLSVASRDLAGLEHVSFAYTIPNRACNILADLETTIDIFNSPKGNLLRFIGGKIDLCTLLQEGDFPDFRKFIPQYLDKGSTVNKSDLTDALDACGVMGDGKMKSVQLAGNNGFMKLSTLGATGTATMTIPFMGDDGLALRLNSRYLLPAAKSLPGDEIFLKYRDALSPIMLIPVDHVHWDERLEVIMPLRG